MYIATYLHSQLLVCGFRLSTYDLRSIIYQILAYCSYIRKLLCMITMSMEPARMKDQRFGIPNRDAPPVAYAPE